jgi:hypothetical protein
MRGHEKYIEKVQDELDIYRKHLHHGDDLPDRFQESWKKIEIARSWIRDGYSDTQVIQLLKNDPSTKLQARRAREVLTFAYEIFADIRLARNPDGVKQRYADELNDAAEEVKRDIKAARDKKESPKEIAALMKVWKDLKTEAAKVDGVFLPTPKVGNVNKKPTKIILKRKTVIQNNNVVADDLTEEAHYEIE